MRQITIREFDFEEFGRAYPVLSQLRPELPLQQYLTIAAQMRERGYRVICLLVDEKIVSYCGFSFTTDLMRGKYLWIYDLVTDEQNRGKGYGGKLLEHIEGIAKDGGASCVALSVFRELAHKFYKKSDYQVKSQLYQKNLLD